MSRDVRGALGLEGSLGPSEYIRQECLQSPLRVRHRVPVQRGLDEDEGQVCIAEELRLDEAAVRVSEELGLAALAEDALLQSLQ
jgi:hypothetical protein